MKKAPENPFRFNQIVERGYFCRRGEEAVLSELLAGGQNAVLIGPRRTGKTSLVFEVCRRTKLKVIHADLMRVDGYAAVIKRLTEAALRDGRPPVVEGLLKSLAHLRPAFTVDPVTGGTHWTVAPSSKSGPDNVVDTLRLIKRRCGPEKGLLFMDEFQDLTALPRPGPLMAQIRSELQKWRGVPVVFAGSDREAMTALFTDRKEPLYQSATVVKVGTIDPKRFRRFIVQRFRAGERGIPEAQVERVLEITNEHPNSTQKLLHVLWNRTGPGTEAGPAELAAALDFTVRTEQDEFERSLGNLTLNQVRVLKALARVGGETPTGKDFLEEAGVPNAASVLRALHRCVDLQILLRDAAGYHFANPFMREWLLRLP